MTDTGRDISKYPLCEPWYGEKGPKFTRRFALDFMSALGTQRDKFATIRDHMKGRDPGGIPPTAAAQLATPPLTENLGVAKKTEHFQRWIHYMRYCVLHGYIYVHLCKTDEMYADALTKISNHASYNRFVKFFFNLN